jgi:phosphatidate cytidylyltransferase
MKMSNFWQRVFTGALFVAMILGAILAEGWYFRLFAIASGLLCLNEFFSIHSVPVLFRRSGLAAAAIMYGLLLMEMEKLIPFSYLILLFIPGFIIATPIIFRQGIDQLQHFGLMATGLFYTVYPFGLLLWFSDTVRMEFILALFIFTWVNDTLAYVCGNLFGRHSFFVALSPKKTIEGVIGGIAFTMAFSYLLYLVFPSTPFYHWLVLALITSAFGIAGDLFESRLKRNLGIKDSGTFFPGHGGFLDRFDALLFAIPFYYLYLIFAVN